MSVYYYRTIRNEKGVSVGYWWAILYPRRRQVYRFMKGWAARSDAFRTVKRLKGKIGILTSVGIDLPARGKGYGKQALCAFLKLCKDKGRKHALLVADIPRRQKNGFDLREWYERHGFRFCGSIRNSSYIFMTCRIRKGHSKCSK